MRTNPPSRNINVPVSSKALSNSHELCDRVTGENLDSVLTRFSRLYTRISQPFYIFFICSDKSQSEIIVSNIENRIDPDSSGNIITFDLQEQFGYNPFLQLGQIEEHIAKSSRDPVFVLANGFEHIMKKLVDTPALGAHDFCQLLKESNYNKDLIQKLHGRKCLLIVHLGDSQGAAVLRAGRISIENCDFKDGYFDVSQ